MGADRTISGTISAAVDHTVGRLRISESHWDAIDPATHTESRFQKVAREAPWRQPILLEEHLPEVPRFADRLHVLDSECAAVDSGPMPPMMATRFIVV
jgi:hypothetical protein